MIIKKNLSLYEESYNDGYTQALQDFLEALKSKHPKNKVKYAEVMEELLNSFGEKDDTK